jgi:hypothetical protein
MLTRIPGTLYKSTMTGEHVILLYIDGTRFILLGNKGVQFIHKHLMFYMFELTSQIVGDK